MGLVLNLLVVFLQDWPIYRAWSCDGRFSPSLCSISFNLSTWFRFIPLFYFLQSFNLISFHSFVLFLTIFQIYFFFLGHFPLMSAFLEAVLPWNKTIIFFQTWQNSFCSTLKILHTMMRRTQIFKWDLWDFSWLVFWCNNCLCKIDHHVDTDPSIHSRQKNKFYYCVAYQHVYINLAERQIFTNLTADKSMQSIITFIFQKLCFDLKLLILILFEITQMKTYI